MTRLFKESFIPVLMVVGGIFLLVVYSHYVADLDADEVTIIEIPAVSLQQLESESLLADDETFIQVEKQRQDDPHYRQAYQLIKDKQWQQAKTVYLELIKQYGTSQAYTDLGYIYYKSGEYSEALNAFTQALESSPVFIAAYFYRAKTLRKLEKYESSVKDYQTYIQHFPSHFFAHFNLGLLRLKQDDYTQAVASFNQASQLAPGRKKSKALLFLGRAYQKMGKEYFAQAQQAYQTSIRVFPGNIKPRMAMASLLPQTEQGYSEALEIYQQVIQLKPNHAPAHFSMAVIYGEQGKTLDALRAYTRAIEFNPSHSAARYNLGLIFLQQNKWQLAADQFHAVIKTNSQHAKAHFNLGRSNYRLKHYDQALLNYQAALDLKQGDYPEVVVNQGLIYSAKKEYSTAISLYRKALAKNPVSAKLHYNLGVAYSKLKQYKPALNAFQEAIKYRPGYAQAWYNIGLIYGRKDSHQQAIKAYLNAVNIKPDYRSAQLNLAVSYSRSGEYLKSENVYRQVLETSPRYASAWINLGLVLMEQKKYAKAEDVLMQAAQLDAENIRVMGLLAKALSRQQKFVAASQYYRIALDMNPDSKKYRLGYVRVLKQQGEYSQAMLEAQKALKLYPRSKKLKRELREIKLSVNKITGSL